GKLSADGGRVLVTARAAQGVVDNVINTTGIVEARSVSVVNGAIVFDAGDGGVSVGGRVDASGTGAGETGGSVKALGGNVTVTADARIDASGDVGGGTVLIGGNFHGAGPEQNARTTSVAEGAVIDASAVSRGDGGKVAVWADGNTVFDGTIVARGGAQGGNGGLVETSGKQNLRVRSGFVDTLAPNGLVGTWLLDPQNITIQTGGGATLTQVQDTT